MVVSQHGDKCVMSAHGVASHGYQKLKRLGHVLWKDCLKNAMNLVDPASSYMLVSRIKPCMSQCKWTHSRTANGSLNQQ